MTDARKTIMALLMARPQGTTICPSEAARKMTPGNGWRRMMRDVHGAVDEMVAEGLVELSWKGQMLRTRRGPYRMAARRHSS